MRRTKSFAGMSDPAMNPMFRRRWTEPLRCDGLRPIGQIAAEVVADLRFRRQVQRLHGLGDRVLGEFLAELGAELGIQTVIDQKLDTYIEIEIEALETAGGDGFWPAPLREVPR